MSDPVLAWQKALVTALDAALSCPVYDDVPKGADMPYVVLDTISTNSADALTNLRDEAMAYLTVWTKYRGRKQAQDFANLIYDTLHRAKLPLEAGRNVRCYVTNRTTRKDLADDVYLAPIRVRALLEH